MPTGGRVIYSGHQRWSLLCQDEALAVYRTALYQAGPLTIAIYNQPAPRDPWNGQVIHSRTTIPPQAFRELSE